MISNIMPGENRDQAPDKKTEDVKQREDRTWHDMTWGGHEHGSKNRNKDWSDIEQESNKRNKPRGNAFDKIIEMTRGKEEKKEQGENAEDEVVKEVKIKKSKSAWRPLNWYRA